MNSSPAPSTGGHLPSCTDVLLETLSSTIGAPFRLWAARTVTTSVDYFEERNRRSDCDDDMAFAADSARENGYCTLHFDEGTLGIWIRLPGILRRQLLAYGVIPNSDPALTDRLIQAACRLIEQKLELLDQSADIDSCIENLTYGLEEQAWLRTLSNHLTLCSARRSLCDVATELLPSLKELVRAESIAILLTRATTGAYDRQSTNQNLITESLWEGPQLVPDDFWQTWFCEESADSHVWPLVQNGPRVDPRLACEDVRSVCAVKIRRSDSIYGWIVATTRNSFQRDTFCEVARGLSESEFGTVEAGLIDAAATMLATHGHNVELLVDRESLVIGVIRAMGHAVDARDPYTRGHSERVGRYGRQIAEAIGLPQDECDRIYLSGLLHDVGKIGIPDAVLAKPGRLTEEEFDIVKRHPEIGGRIVQTMSQLSDLLPGILHHHESIDGTGYPHGLQGDAIPLMGRILAVADAYDAMTSDRPYRQGMPRATAMDILAKRAGIQWDKPLVEAFLSIPEEVLVLEAVEGEHGWRTDESWLRSGAESMFERPTSGGSSQGGVSLTKLLSAQFG